MRGGRGRLRCTTHQKELLPRRYPNVDDVIALEHTLTVAGLRLMRRTPKFDSHHTQYQSQS